MVYSGNYGADDNGSGNKGACGWEDVDSCHNRGCLFDSKEIERNVIELTIELFQNISTYWTNNTKRVYEPIVPELTRLDKLHKSLGNEKAGDARTVLLHRKFPISWQL